MNVLPTAVKGLPVCCVTCESASCSEADLLKGLEWQRSVLGPRLRSGLMKPVATLTTDGQGEAAMTPAGLSTELVRGRALTMKRASNMSGPGLVNKIGECGLESVFVLPQMFDE